MKFSLIMATIGRTIELDNFLRSLDAQTYRNFELIVVGLNPDNRLKSILAPFEEKFPIIHLYSKKGLSNARNVGLKQVSGDIVAFPDDDCEYPAVLLEKVHKFFLENEEYQILTCKSIDKMTRRPSNARWRKQPCQITVAKTFRIAISCTIFYEITDMNKNCYFNPLLGVGSIYGSGEETDFLIRLLKHGNRAFYQPSIEVYHPDNSFDPGKYKESIKRNYYYGLGVGALFKIHLFEKKNNSLLWIFINAMLLRPIAGFVMNCLMLKFKISLIYLYSLYGRWSGLINYPKNIF